MASPMRKRSLKLVLIFKTVDILKGEKNETH
jgi:hypothetical protein